jgi:phosphoenolpyruvate carboxylase
MNLDIPSLDARLGELHAMTAQTPLFNPVFQLGHEISGALERSTVDLDAIEGLIKTLEVGGLHSRARRLQALVAPTDEGENQGRLTQLVRESARRGFETFRERWESALLHCVFTGHPTFLLSDAQSDQVAASATGAEAPTLPNGARAPITIGHEHALAIAAMQRAATARDTVTATILSVAAETWPDRWQTLCPAPFTLATWVGYDMDGRTDISWIISIRFRLEEKAARLEGYVSALTSVDSGLPIIATLIAARDYTSAMAALFAGDLSEAEALSHVANTLTADHPSKLLSLAPVIAEIETAAKRAPDPVALLTIAAAMRTDGLGMGGVHFRVNSSQLDNAIRRRIDPDGTMDIGSRTALIRLRALLDEVQPVASNFAALAVENTTALRQFLAIAQILKHIDAEAAVRMLIAECEQPTTVLAALYFAKLLGVDGKVDVSPLFETEAALEHGARFLDALLAEPAYQAYAKMRGQVAIQTGFSDAGRFIGQIPAALAIERLQGRLAKIMADNGLSKVAARIFNTHGEGMGRGAHPAGLRDRLRWPMSDWARAQFAHQGIRTEIEASFQGGDGFLLFGHDALALALLTRIAEIESEPHRPDTDIFFRRTDLSLDFYRGIRRAQRTYMASRSYARAITAFGLGMLVETGSRKSRRQSDLAADREMNLRQIRAIPHNAVLQQLGYPVNVIAGVGTAAGDDPERLVTLINESDRAGALVRLLRATDKLASIKSVAAYGELFNSAYWASRPYRGTEQHLQRACLALAQRLEGDDRVGAFRRLATRLRVDALKLHGLLDLLGDQGADADRQGVRRTLGLLHAVRLALMQHMFLKAVQIPVFSRKDDVSRDDILDMVFTLRIDEAVARLRDAFPVEAPSISDFDVTEPTGYPDRPDPEYAKIQSAFIDPIADAHALSLRISVVIANHFGAHG